MRSQLVDPLSNHPDNNVKADLLAAVYVLDPRVTRDHLTSIMTCYCIQEEEVLEANGVW